MVGCGNGGADTIINNPTNNFATNTAKSVGQFLVTAQHGSAAPYGNPVSAEAIGQPVYGATSNELVFTNVTISGTGSITSYALDQSLTDSGAPNPSGNFISNISLASGAGATGSGSVTGILPGINWVALTNNSATPHNQFAYTASRIDKFPTVLNATLTPPPFTVLPSLVYFTDVTTIGGAPFTIANASLLAVNITQQVYVNTGSGFVPTAVTNGNITEGTTQVAYTSLPAGSSVVDTTISGNATNPVDNVTTPFNGTVYGSLESSSPGFGFSTDSNGILSSASYSTTLTGINQTVLGIVIPGSFANPTTGILEAPGTTYTAIENETVVGGAEYTAVNQTLVNASTALELYNFTGTPGMSVRTIGDVGNVTSPPFPNPDTSFDISGAINPYATYVSPDGNYLYVTEDETLPYLTNFTVEGIPIPSSNDTVGGTQSESFAGVAGFVVQNSTSPGVTNFTAASLPVPGAVHRGFIATYQLDHNTGAFVHVADTPTPAGSSDAREIAFNANGSKAYVSCYSANTVFTGDPTNATSIGYENGTVAEYAIDPTNGTMTLDNSYLTGPGALGICVDKSNNFVYVSCSLTNAGAIALAELGYSATFQDGSTFASPNSLAVGTVQNNNGLLNAPVGSIEVFPLASDGTLQPSTESLATNATALLSGTNPGVSFPMNVVVSPLFNSVFAVNRQLQDPHVRSVVARDANGTPTRVIIAGAEDNITGSSAFGNVASFITAGAGTSPQLTFQNVSTDISVTPLIGGARNAEGITATPDGRYLYVSFRADPPVYNGFTTSSQALVQGASVGSFNDFSVGLPGEFTGSFNSNQDNQARLVTSQPLGTGAGDPVMSAFFSVLRD
jgi:hypothetical protein